jgi:hypothetical protein
LFCVCAWAPLFDITIVVCCVCVCLCCIFHILISLFPAKL